MCIRDRAQALQMPVSSVEPVLEELRTRYAREDSGLCLLHLNTHWQLATKADFAEPVRRVLDTPVSYTHLRAHETDSYLVSRMPSSA